MKRIKFKLKNVLIENKINQNKLVQILKVMSPSTVNGMSNRDIKKINIETLAKVSGYFKKTILGNYS
ncbi:helix-turn-helix domain-containing protein [Bacillus cereus]|uniref:helix-turn-helix domain-containing protein n=1 Tax=Bacillus cereus TaxID=1396 RepID=UPI000942C137